MQMNDCGYIIGAMHSNNPSTVKTDNLNAWLIKTDKYGKVEWEKTCDDFFYAQAVIQTQEGGYLFVDRVRSRLAKTNHSATTKWLLNFKDAYLLGYM